MLLMLLTNGLRPMIVHYCPEKDVGRLSGNSFCMFSFAATRKPVKGKP